MATLTVEKEILELENDYWQAIQDKDVATAARLTDFPCMVAGASGIARVDEPTFVKMMSSAKYTLNDFKIDDAEVRLLNDETALVAYKVREDLTVEGRKVKMEAADASVWINRDGQWRCALHTESLQGDPYGRDKK